MNPTWQQRKLREYCEEKGVHVAAYSPLGGQNWLREGNAVLDSEVLVEIAKAREKSFAQVHTYSNESLKYRFCTPCRIVSPCHQWIHFFFFIRWQ